MDRPRQIVISGMSVIPTVGIFLFSLFCLQGFREEIEGSGNRIEDSSVWLMLPFFVHT